MKSACRLLSLTFLLGGCLAPTGTLKRPAPDSASRAVSPASRLSSQPLLSPSATIQTRGSSLTLAMSLGEGFRTQALDCAQVAFVNVSVSGPGMPSPLYANAADAQQMLPIGAGCGLNASFTGIPYGLRLISVELYDAARQPLAATPLQGVLRVDGSTQNFTLSYRQLPVARAIQQLLSGSPEQAFFAQQQDLTALQTTVDAMIGLGGTFPNETYTQHPALVDSARLAQDLVTSTLQPAANYRQSGSSLNVTVQGLLGTDRFELSAGDSTSQPASFGVSGGVFTGLVPGAPLQLQARTLPGAGTSYSFAFASDATAVAEGGSRNLTVTATPVAVTATQPTAAAFSGDSLTLTGTGFHTQGQTLVTIGGQPAPVTAASATSLSVTVPAGLSAGSQPVEIKVGSRSAQTTATIARRIFVDVNASGAQTGQSWTDAYQDLQSGLAAAQAGDQIWIADGTYLPTQNPDAAGARDISFQLKQGVSLYGGFSGHETRLDQADPDVYRVVLSGDLKRNDFLNLNNLGLNSGLWIYLFYQHLISDNSRQIVIGANQALLDGITVTSAYQDNAFETGGGIYNNGTSPRLHRVAIIANISRNPGAGMMNKNGAAPELSQVVFHSNLAVSSEGGGVFNIDSSPSFRDVSFVSNRSENGNGGGMMNVRGSLTMQNVLFYANSSGSGHGGAMYNANTTLTIRHATFFENSAQQASSGGFFSIHSNLTLHNCIFRNSPMRNYEGGSLSFNATTYATGDLTIDAGSLSETGSSHADPLFRDTSNPIGIDMRPGTPDDGLQLQTGSPARDSGDPNVSTPLDLLGLTRDATPDRGAYEVQP